MSYRFTITILLVSLLAGCANQPSGSETPSWITNPTQNGKFVAGIGSAGEHIDGKEAQKNLAISRAVDMIARQLGVTVNSELTTKKNANASGVSSSLKTYSFHSVDGVKVNAVIKEFYEDRFNGKIYVWMVKND